MQKRVENFLINNNLIGNKKVFMIGFSGGFDSMSLADILGKLSQKYGFKIVLAHLNHNWRGEKAKLEENNCRDFALDRNLEFYVETLPADLPHTESVAREERYKFFYKAAKKYAATAIFTAHTQSDNIETILQRIIKGTGVSGLTGIPQKRMLNDIIVFRPMLDISREEVLKYCEQNNLQPNSDDSNFDTKYLRNKIRNELLPYLKNYDNNIENSLQNLIILANDNEEIVGTYFEELEWKLLVGNRIVMREFLKLSKLVQRRIIKDMLVKECIDYDFHKINNELLNFIISNSSSKSGTTISVAKDKWLFINREYMEIISEKVYNKEYAQIEIPKEGEYVLDEFCATLKITKWSGEIPSVYPDGKDLVALVDLSEIAFPLQFRTRQDGDRIIPFGKHTPIKLKKFLNNKGISKHEKSSMLFLAANDEILWAVHAGLSNKLRVKTIPTHKLEVLIKEQL